MLSVKPEDKVSAAHKTSYSRFCCYALSLTRIGYNAIDEEVNACSLLRDFSNQCEDIRLDDGSNFFPDVTLFLLRDFL